MEYLCVVLGRGEHRIVTHSVGKKMAVDYPSCWVAFVGLRSECEAYIGERALAAAEQEQPHA